MKNGRILFLLAWLVIFSGLTECSSAEKALIERQNYMMPKTSDLPRNSSKFKEPKKHKTYKPRKHKKRKAKCLFK